MKTTELLAPAGNFENFYAAINNGADAVYLGLNEFNARGNIENFNLDNIKSAIDFAHYFGVKVYLALNTLISDSEMSRVLDVVEKALKFGIDAFIIQDLGLAFNIRKAFPNAVLHASTQMGICNLEGVKILEKFGFERVVLARETQLSEIERIKANSNIEIEFFVQGALCVSYSGNCYISAFSCNASGNRGKCKQFCRLPYSIINGQEKKSGFLLSAKDFCMLDQLQALIDAGVCSFKIEGRARRAGYVAQTVSVYRKALDKILKKQIFDEKKAKQSLKAAFNRGNFASGYFKDEKIIDPDIQGHRGLLIGKVIDVKFGRKFNLITIKADRKISRGDGLKFILKNKEMASLGVGDVKEISKNVYEITTTAKAQKDCDVALTLDSFTETELLSKQRKIKISAIFKGRADENALLTFIDIENKTQVEVKSEMLCQEAQSCALSSLDISNQFKKGLDIFELDQIHIDADNIFLRKAELNDLRRKAVEELKAKILENYSKTQLKEFRKNNIDLKFENQVLPKQEAFIFNNITQLDRSYKYKKLIYAPEIYSSEGIKKVCSKLLDCEIYLSLPIFASVADINLFNKIFNENPQLHIFANNYYALNFASSRQVFVSNNLNVYNSSTILALKSLGVKDIIVSSESEETLFNSGTNLYSLTDAKQVYMNFLHCPFKEHFNSTCANCKFKPGVVYQMQNGQKLELTRTKAVTCNFQLQTTERKQQRNSYNKVISLK